MKLLTKALTSLRGSSKSTTLITIEKLKQKTTKFKHGLIVAMLGASTLAFTSSASATLIDSINSLNPGDKYRVLFVTSTTRDATSADIIDYNTFVQAAAAAGSVTNPLGLNWNVLGSTEAVNAQANTNISNTDNTQVTFFNTLGDIVATSGSDLWDGTLLAPIIGDEYGLANPTTVYTGTDFLGNADSLAPLGPPSGFSVVGHSRTTSEIWVEWQTYGNPVVWSFYGASGVSIIPTAHPQLTSVPEPGSSLILLGFAGLLFSRYRKQS